MSSESTGEEEQTLSSAVREFQDVFTSPEGKLARPIWPSITSKQGIQNYLKCHAVEYPYLKGTL